MTGRSSATPSGVDGANGVFRYGTSGFPGDSFGNTNYWVDVVFGTTPPPDVKAPTVVSSTPVGGSTGVSITDPVVVGFSEAMNQSSVAVTLSDAGSNVVAGSLSYASATNKATLTPNAPLAPGTTYSVTVTGTTGAISESSLGFWSLSAASLNCSTSSGGSLLKSLP